jgi:hypothetical protein
MMGVNMGYQPGPRESILKKYAYFPTKTNSNKWVWLDEYYEVQIYYDENGKPPVKSLFWKQILNKKEFLLWTIKNPVRETILTRGKRALYYYKR